MTNSIYITQHQHSIRHSISTASARHLYTILYYTFLYKGNTRRRHTSFTGMILSLFFLFKNRIEIINPVCVAVGRASSPGRGYALPWGLFMYIMRTPITR